MLRKEESREEGVGPSSLPLCLLLSFDFLQHVVELLVFELHIFRPVVVGCFPANPFVQANDVAREFFDGRQLIVELNLKCDGLLERCE